MVLGGKDCGSLWLAVGGAMFFGFYVTFRDFVMESVGVFIVMFYYVFLFGLIYICIIVW